MKGTKKCKVAKRATKRTTRKQTTRRERNPYAINKVKTLI